MDEDGFFPLFAMWAKQLGLEDAERRARGVVPEDILTRLIEKYRRLVDGIEVSDPPVIHGARDPWYPGPIEGDRFWPSLEAYLTQNLGWDDDRMKPVDESSTKVVANTPRPERPAWTCKGLVVGYVQSGKTTNYTSVIAKAADNGYKLVIVLSGMHNGLRRQTQQRLDTQLCQLVPDAWLTLTGADDDFRAPAMSSVALLKGQKSKIALCVVKKNGTVLKRLQRWLQDAAEQGTLAELPVLVVDDEADQASVQTKTINPLILGILEKLPRCTYLAYTATPFANLLIDPGAGDLYPSDFIINLPRPEGYFGTERIFGRDLVEGDEANGPSLDGYDMVRIIEDDEVASVSPAGRAAAASFEPEITSSLEDALRWFWLATATRRARGDDGHSTMLIHTSIKTTVHESFRDPLLDYRDDLLRGLEAGDADLVDELRSLWNSETGKVPADTVGAAIVPVSFDQILEQLTEVVGSTKVVLDNYRSDDRLDYTTPSQVAIAVGGNTLSRGLTLEGLVVSFFVRAAQAYDTLLQMARWFGFRPGYEDLPRIWMTRRLEEWFRHLATVEHEIRLDIDRYEHQGLTPTEFGVRIRTHPVLRVTAKMGAAVPAYASYGGRRVQTRYFKEQNADWLGTNLRAADDLIRSIRQDGGRARSLTEGASLFEAVDADLIERFLGAYQAHEDSPDLDSALLLRYIRKQRANGSLDLWSVAVMSTAKESNGQVRLGGLDFNRISRSKLKGTGPDRADVKTLMSKDHRVVDLPITPAQARAKNETALIDERNNDPVGQSRGLLLLYPVDPQSQPDKTNEASRAPLDAVDDVIGLGLVFPGNAERGQVKNTYITVDLSAAAIEENDAEVAELTDAGGS